MAEHCKMVTLSGGIPGDLTIYEEQADGTDIPVMRVPGVLKGFEGIAQRAAVVWRDGEDRGEIEVKSEWARSATPTDRDAAVTLADQTAGRRLRWRFMVATGGGDSVGAFD